METLPGLRVAHPLAARLRRRLPGIVQWQRQEETWDTMMAATGEEASKVTVARCDESDPRARAYLLLKGTRIPEETHP